MKILKSAAYGTPSEVTKAVNERIYASTTRSLVQIVYESDTFLGSSVGRFVVFYTEDENES